MSMGIAVTVWVGASVGASVVLLALFGFVGYRYEQWKQAKERHHGHDRL